MNARAMEFAAYDAARHAIELEYQAAIARLKALGAGTGPMGLTPDSIKFSPEFRQAKGDCDSALRALQALNKHNAKRFAPEIRARAMLERERRAAMP